MKLSQSVHCYLDGARGQYIPRDFARETKRECIKGASAEDLDYLALGPGGCMDEQKELVGDETTRGEFYWDVWQDILDNATVIDPESGEHFKLHMDDSLFLVPEDWEWNEETESFERPESDTLRRYELPAHWASFIANGDDSGIDPEDVKAIEQFMVNEDLTLWMFADVSENTWFSHSCDAPGQLAGTMARYTFVLIK